jgi:hypothetical protein
MIDWLFGENTCERMTLLRKSFCGRGRKLHATTHVARGGRDQATIPSTLYSSDTHAICVYYTYKVSVVDKPRMHYSRTAVGRANFFLFICNQVMDLLRQLWREAEYSRGKTA